MLTKEKKLVGWHIGFALVALAVGSLFGPLQALEHAKLDLYPYLKPFIASYYQGLTLHGVLNAIVFTTFFIMGFQVFVTIKGLGRPLKAFNLALAGLIVMILGTVLAGWVMLTNEATVLYTFYPPLQADALFYIGATLLVVGSWMVGWTQFISIAAWRKDHPGERTPFITFAAGINAAMWQIATLGVAAEMLLQLIPWSLGLIAGTDVLLDRTFFWWFGHPLVYFWLLPAYISWYGMLPKQVGGKMFSDTLARLAFWMFLIFSTPVGFHHQFADPGIPQSWKLIHSALTFLVAIPSFLTAFTVIAALEKAGRAKGGQGLFGWIKALPWSDPAVSAQLLAGIMFMFGGLGGIINASFSVNLVVHNTAWIPGHFHTTVATGVTLTFLGITYWLVPHFTGKALASPKLATAANWLWFVGMAIFSSGMHWIGLLGAPRRVPFATASYDNPEWHTGQLMSGIGGSILFFAGLFYFIVIIQTLMNKQTAQVDVPVAESEAHPSQTPAWLDNWTPWLIVAATLLIMAYGPMLAAMFQNINMTSPGFRVW